MSCLLWERALTIDWLVSHSTLMQTASVTLNLRQCAILPCELWVFITLMQHYCLLQVSLENVKPSDRETWEEKIHPFFWTIILLDHFAGVLLKQRGKYFYISTATNVERQHCCNVCPCKFICIVSNISHEPVDKFKWKFQKGVAGCTSTVDWLLESIPFKMVDVNKYINTIPQPHILS